MSLALPDVPRWVEAHGIAADPQSWRAGGAIGSERAKLGVIIGDADLAELRRGHPDYTFLAMEPPTVAHGRALLHTLPDPTTLPEFEGAVPLGDVTLDHLPPALAAELRAATTTVWTVFVDGAPACFAYAPWRSAAYFDVSVDTLPGARQLGLGTLVAAAMIRHERAQGREPVWGADEHHHASLHLAQRLGFTQVDALYVIPPETSRRAVASIAR